ncbi:MAG: hypothetical protein AAF727_16040 [Pseudomonadota bacterium]
MTTPGRATLFLERRSYRRRRMMDALRLLPVLGVLLWMLPLFWPTSADGPGATDKMAMSTAVTYVFVVWLALIGAALALWSVLRTGPEIGEDTNSEPP